VNNFDVSKTTVVFWKMGENGAKNGKNGCFLGNGKKMSIFQNNQNNQNNQRFL